ncbi:J domain-containing protein required for chloroplast accumulation response 1 [Hordeum vulgare]|nr:J domain-containing protein required for chloroplast accumulation response 1 [Hordeum vulgare]
MHTWRDNRGARLALRLRLRHRSRARSGAEERPAFGDRTSSGFASRERRSGGESGLGERPVFGDRTSSERRQLGQEFYKDIFPGGEPTSPGGSTSRLLSRSSFSMKFTRGVDSSLPTSPSRLTSNGNDDDTSYGYSVSVSPNSSTNSSFAQGVSQKDSKKNPFSWHRYPFLSQFRSSGDKKEKDTSQRVNSMDNECEGTPISSASFISSDKFHFSFYKWAGQDKEGARRQGDLRLMVDRIKQGEGYDYDDDAYCSSGVYVSLDSWTLIANETTFSVVSWSYHYDWNLFPLK